MATKMLLLHLVICFGISCFSDSFALQSVIFFHDLLEYFKCSTLFLFITKHIFIHTQYHPSVVDMSLQSEYWRLFMFIELKLDLMFNIFVLNLKRICLFIVEISLDFRYDCISDSKISFSDLECLF